MGEKAVCIAARIFSGNPRNDGLLNADLYDTLEELDRMIKPSIASEETVAAVILCWVMTHPDEIAYGE